MTTIDETGTQLQRTTRLSEFVAGGQDAPTSGLQDAASRTAALADTFRQEFLAAAAAAPAAPDLDSPGQLLVPAAWSAPSGPAVDWVSRHDPRSREFAVRAMLRQPVAVQDRLWPTGPVMDQGMDGACVGFAVAAASNVLEAVDGGADFLTADDARAIYSDAQDLDEFPGRDYIGTSVLAGMKAGADRSRMLWDGYVWAFGTRDVAQAVLQVGPVVIGVPWLSGMHETGPDGVVLVTGSAGEGHSLCINGIVTSHAGRPGPWFRWQNSYGTDYGLDGFGFIHHKDLGRLLAGVGEASIPVVPAVAPPSP